MPFLGFHFLRGAILLSGCHELTLEPWNEWQLLRQRNYATVTATATSASVEVKSPMNAKQQRQFICNSCAKGLNSGVLFFGLAVSDCRCSCPLIIGVIVIVSVVIMWHCQHLLWSLRGLKARPLNQPPCIINWAESPVACTWHLTSSYTATSTSM